MLQVVVKGCFVFFTFSFNLILNFEWVSFAMNQLEKYIASDFISVMKEKEEVEVLLKKVFPLFLNTNLQNQWPYEISKDSTGSVEPQVPGKDDYSYSTNSMILAMLYMADSISTANVLFPKMHRNSVLDLLLPTDKYQKLKSIMRSSYNKLIDESVSAFDESGIWSGTYGRNDPLTLLWLAKLCRLKFGKEKGKSSEAKIRCMTSCAKKPSSPKSCKVCGGILKRLEQLTKREKDTVGKFLLDFDVNAEHGGNRCERRNKKVQKCHSFVLLRYYQLLSMFKLDQPEKISGRLYRFFDSKVHQNLSYFSIPDSRFDPAELVFSMEGALLTNKDAVSNEAINRFFEVITGAQKSTPYWKPVNPIYSTHTGEILLPLSIEIANSLLRIVSLLDSREYVSVYFSKGIHLFERYFRWLQAQVVTFSDNNFEYVGWGSEHVGMPNEIHIWQTSEIVTFLLNFRSLLQKHIADECLIRSNLSYQLVEKDSSWDVICSEREPIQNLTTIEHFLPYSYASRKFVTPVNKQKSILLYGPPGTGKTSFASTISAELGWKLITVTPSDFLAGGAGEVEARAKAIFTCLEQQYDAVILFDEIDQFLLDRESDAYEKQTGIFQFMTPGMLPKLQNLYNKTSCIFVIATNYEERIDSAIKRAGRVDVSLLLSLPDLKAREQILAKLGRKHFDADLDRKSVV